MSYYEIHLVQGASLLMFFPELYSIGVEPGGCIGDIEAGRWKAVIVFANLSVYNHDVMLPVEEGDVLMGGDVL